MNRSFRTLMRKSATGTNAAGTPVPQPGDSLDETDMSLLMGRDMWNNSVDNQNHLFTTPWLRDIPYWQLGAGFGGATGGLIGYGLNSWRKNRQIEKNMNKGYTQEEAEILSTSSPWKGAGIGALVGGAGLGIGLPMSMYDSPKMVGHMSNLAYSPLIAKKRLEYLHNLDPNSFTPDIKNEFQELISREASINAQLSAIRARQDSLSAGDVSIFDKFKQRYFPNGWMPSGMGLVNVTPPGGP